MISTKLYGTCPPSEREAIDRLLDAVEAVESYGYIVGILSPSDVVFADDEITIEEGRHLLDWSRDQIHEYLFEEDWEVDFFATRPGSSPLLVQVCADTTADETWDRELRSLVEAAREHPDAEALLVTQDASPPVRALPAGLKWMSAAQWLLE
jgi:hypothetical protein